MCAAASSASNRTSFPAPAKTRHAVIGADGVLDAKLVRPAVHDDALVDRIHLDHIPAFREVRRDRVSGAVIEAEIGVEPLDPAPYEVPDVDEVASADRR